MEKISKTEGSLDLKLRVVMIIHIHSLHIPRNLRIRSGGTERHSA